MKDDTKTDTGLGGPAPIGLFLLDRELRFVRLNDRLAEINEKPLKAHLGRSISEVFPPDLAALLEPVCRQTLETGEPSEAVEYTGPSVNGDARHWLLSIRPAASDPASPAAFHVTCEDITRRKRRELGEAEQFRFEQLIAELIARFVNIAPNGVDGAIDTALSEVMLFLGAERGSVILLDENSDTMEATHSRALPGVAPFPLGRLSADFPFWDSVIRDGRIYAMSAIDELPPEAGREKRFCEQLGIRSSIQVPLAVGGEVIGVLGFSTIRDERQWPPALVDRLRIVGHTFANVLDRRKADREIADRLRFERLIAEFSKRFVNIPTEELDGEIIRALKEVGDFLDVERVSIGRLRRDSSDHRATHSWAAPGHEPFPTSVNLAEALPYYNKVVKSGAVFRMTKPEDLLPEAEAERALAELEGIRSALTIPIDLKGTLVGGIALDSLARERDWPDHLVSRLRLVGEILLKAVVHQQAELEVAELQKRLESENLYLREEVKLQHRHSEIIGQSAVIRAVLQQVEQVAPTDSTVLITGETGTGKELVARAIHGLSGRRQRAMIRVNCASLPSTLVESELFGREKGAYTGALTSQAGRFELADGSTIFLDEISELPLELQAKLLRVLQEGEFERLGSTKTRTVDARIVAATNRDLDKAVAEGRFRQDLYYRLNVFPIDIPPLRDRREDVPQLVWAFVQEFSEKMGKTVETIPVRVMDRLKAADWPGNVRELRNVIERGMILTTGPEFQAPLPQPPAAAAEDGSLALADVERAHILSVLELTGWRVSGTGGAAERLGLKPTTLNARMAKLGIRRP